MATSWCHMTEEAPGQKMAKNAKRLYEEGVMNTAAWHKRMREDQRKTLLKKGEADDHKRGAVSPLGGDGWWSNAS